MIALPPGPFGAVYADPPWNFKNYSAKGDGRSPSRHYDTMTLADIKALPVADVCAKDCHLFLWTTQPHLQQAFEVMTSWGFKYSSIAFTWVKLNRSAPTLFMDYRSFHVGLGKTTRKNTEVCLLGRRGSPQRLSAAVRELIISPVREHSRKPEDAAKRIEEYAPGPYLEMFARSERGGQWSSWGNQTDRFAAL
jgi:N6-adenosine-specific RNA methylase IME4